MAEKFYFDAMMPTEKTNSTSKGFCVSCFCNCVSAPSCFSTGAVVDAFTKPIENTASAISTGLTQTYEATGTALEQTAEATETALEQGQNVYDENQALIHTGGISELLRQEENLMGSDVRLVDNAVTGGLIQHTLNAQSISTDLLNGNYDMIKEDLKSGVIVGAAAGAAYATGGASLTTQLIVGRTAGSIAGQVLSGNFKEALEIAQAYLSQYIPPEVSQLIETGQNYYDNLFKRPEQAQPENINTSWAWVDNPNYSSQGAYSSDEVILPTTTTRNILMILGAGIILAATMKKLKKVREGR